MNIAIIVLKCAVPVILAVEHWLSKTDKVDAGSIVGVVLNVVQTLIGGDKK